MKKLLLTCVLLGFAVAAMAQQKMTVNLVKSDEYVRDKLNGIDIFRVYNGTFVQKYSTLKADSAIMYPNTNIVDALGHVVINQGDTLHIYSDKLNYNDNTKVAILTGNVRMVDKDAVLTTNYLTYNTATKVGTYVDGGKLVSKDNVLTSKNGYYYAGTRDVYFRYNVVTTSPDALIKTDTMRYNSGTRITYFYGPTRIYGKKDKDTLYTENGTYNTRTEQAFFGKRNRYSQGTKSLKGDSLFYDKLKGYGKAIKNITFEDTEQKMILKGDLGEYFKADDKAVITQKPYVIFVTEQKDTTKATPPNTNQVGGHLKDSATISGKVKNLAKAAPKNLPAINTKSKAEADSLIKANASKIAPLSSGLVGASDSLAKAIAKLPAVKNTMPLATDQMKDSAVKAAAAMGLPIPATIKPKPGATGAVKPLKQIVKASGKTAAKPPAAKTLDSASVAEALQMKVQAKKDSIARIKRDTMYIGADTLETQIVTYKALTELQEKRRLAGIRDTSLVPRRPFVPYTAKTMPKVFDPVMPALHLSPPDYIDRPLLPIHQKKLDTAAKASIPAKALADTKAKTTTDKKPAIKAGTKNADGKVNVGDKAEALPDSVLASQKADSLKMPKPLSDTSRVRILSAHHNVHIYKSDLQGKSDSLFYSSADSVIRSFVNPMYWTQGAQLSGDTIYLQLKNKKADNMTVFPKAFVVYIEKNDSTTFNQLSGKRLKAWFRDNKIGRVFVSGNAETVYFNRNEKTSKVTEMQRSESSTIDINFKNGDMINISFRLQSTNKVFPIAKAKEDDKILKAFIWKPKERPASKEDVINPKKRAPEPDAPKKGGINTGKPAVKGQVPSAKPEVKPAGKDSVSTVPPVTVIKPAKSDPAEAAKTDTLRRFPAIIPAVKKDTVVKKP